MLRVWLPSSTSCCAFPLIIVDWRKITSDYLDAFDKLLDAYERIAETMPRLRTLGDTFKDNPTLLTKLALYYAEVLEFHRRAYKFVRRKCRHANSL
jgi:hypothetical protein